MLAGCSPISDTDLTNAVPSALLSPLVGDVNVVIGGQLVECVDGCIENCGDGSVLPDSLDDPRQLRSDVLLKCTPNVCSNASTILPAGWSNRMPVVPMSTPSVPPYL